MSTNTQTQTAIRKKRAAVDPITDIVLRLPASMLREIDTAVGNRHPRVSRNFWILEAVTRVLEVHAASRERAAAIERRAQQTGTGTTK